VDRVGQTIGKMSNYQSFVINTDIAGNPGVHWLAARIEPRILRVIDPLGANNDRGTDHILKREALKSGRRVIFHPYAMQTLNSDHCGYFAVAIAHLLQKMNAASPIAIGNMLIKHFGKTPDRGDLCKALAIYDRIPMI